VIRAHAQSPAEAGRLARPKGVPLMTVKKVLTGKALTALTALTMCVRCWTVHPASA